METTTKSPQQPVTPKKASEITGASVGFINDLARAGKLTRYKINSATYIDLVQFAQLCKIERF